MLSLNGLKSLDVARAVGVAPETVCMVIRRKRKSAKVERFIADAIRLPLTEVFPDASVGRQSAHAETVA